MYNVVAYQLPVKLLKLAYDPTTALCGVVQQLTNLVQPNVYLNIQHEHDTNYKTRVFIPKTTRAQIECSRTGYTK